MHRAFVYQQLRERITNTARLGSATQLAGYQILRSATTHRFWWFPLVSRFDYCTLSWDVLWDTLFTIASIWWSANVRKDPLMCFLWQPWSPATPPSSLPLALPNQLVYTYKLSLTAYWLCSRRELRHWKIGNSLRMKLWHLRKYTWYASSNIDLAW